MRFLLTALPLAALAGCAPPPYETTQGGVGFGDYADYLSARTAQSRAPQSAAPAPQPIVPLPHDPNAAPSGAELAAAGIGGPPTASAPQPAPQSGASQPLSALAPAAPAPGPVGAAVPVAISDEQDFSAVSSRETIESDKQRIEQNRAQYVQIPATELPARTSDDSSVIVQYAISAPNRLGETIYKRSGLSLSSHAKACGRYGSPEAAQEAFLRSGGPQRDPKNLDPDGDGFACTWDPTPFQKVRG
jgi:hypothetical protein